MDMFFCCSELISGFFILLSLGIAAGYYFHTYELFKIVCFVCLFYALNFECPFRTNMGCKLKKYILA